MTQAAHTEHAAALTPYFQRMTRKEARIREDQYIALARLVPVLARRRHVRSGPRLTENTLIRVAIDLLLSQADRLAGDTEAQLRASLLPPAPTEPLAPDASGTRGADSGAAEPGPFRG